MVVVLDSGPLSLLAAPLRVSGAGSCRQWASTLLAAGHRIVIPEIADYETRRELLRARKTASINRLNGLPGQFLYLALTTPVMRRAAELWAFARQTGQPTAGDDTIDAD